MSAAADLGRAHDPAHEPTLPDLRALLGPHAPSVLIEAGDHAGFTFALAGTEPGIGGRRAEPLTLKVATGPSARSAVERETRMLVELRRRRLGAVQNTIPRYAGTRYYDGHPAVLCSTLPGESMAVGYHQLLHTARPELVRRDLALAGSWLAAFQQASFGPTTASTWVAETREAVERRWCGHALLDPARAILDRAAERLDGHAVELCAVHGAFTYENVLVGPDGVTGVLNWSRGELEGSPLRDLGRFAVAYSASLDRGTRPGRRVLGHPGLRRGPGLPGLRYTLLGRSWYARVVRGYLADGLTRLGIPEQRAGDVLVAAIGEVAATSHDERTAEDHLAALADLPV